MAEAGIEAPGTVLVVDDHPVVRRIAHRLLTEAGFRAFEAASGDGLAELDVPFLAKPFTRDELVKKVREALSRIPRSTQRSTR